MFDTSKISFFEEIVYEIIRFLIYFYTCFVETPFISKKQSKELITYYKILDLPSASFEIE